MLGQSKETTGSTALNAAERQCNRPRFDRHELRRTYGLLFAIFAGSRVFYYAIGIRFDGSAVRIAWQLLPEQLLRTDLLRSLWYLHAQPPAFNALVGALLDGAGGKLWALHVAYLAMGFALACTMFALMLELEAPRGFSLIASALFVVSPITVLYENWLFYTYPVALLLCGAALCFARFGRTNRIGYVFGYGSCVALLALTRSSYHLVWALAAGALLLVMCPRARRVKTLVAAGIPLMLVVGLYAKNEILFGEPTSSSWLGMNLANIAYSGDYRQVRQDVAAHRLSKVSLIGPFAPIIAYPNVTLPHTGIPALDLISSGTSHPNFNNEAYIKVSNEYQSDVVTFIRLHPGLYLHHVSQSIRVASVSASAYKALVDNRAHMRPLVALQNRLLGEVRDYSPDTPRETGVGWVNVAWLVVVQYLAIGVTGIWLVGRAARALMRRRSGLTSPQWAFVLIACTVIYTTLADDLLDLGENNRFRFETDPLVWVAATALVAHAFSATSTRLNNRRGRLLHST